jgi:hypothetical protein
MVVGRVVLDFLAFFYVFDIPCQLFLTNPFHYSLYSPNGSGYNEACLGTKKLLTPVCMMFFRNVALFFGALLFIISVYWRIQQSRPPPETEPESYRCLAT